MFNKMTDLSPLSSGKMWPLITSIFYLTCVCAYLRPPNNPPFIIEDRFKDTVPQLGDYSRQQWRPQTYEPRTHSTPAILNSPSYNLPGYSKYPVITTPTSYNNYGPPRSPSHSTLPYPEDPYKGSPYNNYNTKYNPAIRYYLRSKSLRSAHGSPKKNTYEETDLFPLDLDYTSAGGSDLIFSDPDPPLIEPRSYLDNPSYFEDLELTESFGKYLMRRTQLDPSSTFVNDAAYQYNALLAVLVALARVIRNSCADFEQVYDQIYLPTVETYYKYGLVNADKVSTMIEAYIRKGNARMPKITKLKQELCEKELFCSVAFDNHINNTPLVYVKELETLEAVANLARSYYPYMEEFDQAAQKAAVLSYLKKNKEKLKEYIMNVINSVEHLTDKQVKCT